MAFLSDYHSGLPKFPRFLSLSVVPYWDLYNYLSNCSTLSLSKVDSVHDEARIWIQGVWLQSLFNFFWRTVLWHIWWHAVNYTHLKVTLLPTPPTALLPSLQATTHHIFFCICFQDVCGFFFFFNLWFLALYSVYRHGFLSIYFVWGCVNLLEFCGFISLTKFWRFWYYSDFFLPQALATLLGFQLHV